MSLINGIDTYFYHGTAGTTPTTLLNGVRDATVNYGTVEADVTATRFALYEPSRLLLPAALATVQGQAVPVGPLHDTVTGRACYLSETGLCVPVDTTALPAKATAGYLSDRCQGPLYLALTLDQARGRDLFDGERVYVVKTATGAISASTLMGSARDSNGACYQTTVKAPTGSDFWFEVASVEKAGAVFASVL